MLLAVLCSLILSQLHFPVAWLIGPLTAGIGYALARGGPMPLPRIFTTIGKSLVGVAAAARFSPNNLLTAATYAVPLFTALAITGGLSMLNGYLIARWSGIGLMTSLLGAIPGTASANVAISSEFGADPAAVAILQYLRLVIVVLLVPMIAGFFAPKIVVINATSVAMIGTASAPLWNITVLGIVCFLGIGLGNALKLPTKEFLGSFLCGLGLFGFFPAQYDVPRPLILVALLLIGLSAGLKFNLKLMNVLKRAVLLEVALVLFLVVCCMGIGYEFHRLTQVDMITSLLAFAPGGMEAMIATSNQLGSNTGLVLTIKFIHQILIILTVNSLRVYLRPIQYREN
jgi:uncharacterized protein